MYIYQHVSYKILRRIAKIFIRISTTWVIEDYYNILQPIVGKPTNH